ncbi:MAG: hypothetical protein JJU01_04790 [Alkalibacterium sp.]|nr:hypothetical protein [Alkalibacterium sp.]
MKKLIAFLGLLGVIGLGGYYLASRNDLQLNPFDTVEEMDELVGDYLFGSDLVVGAQSETFLTLDDVEEASDIIIIGEKTAQGESHIINNEEGVAAIPYTPSEIRVQRVIRGNEELEGQTITILENEAYDSERFLVLHAAGYEMMEIGNRYLLMLKDTNVAPYYLITGLSYGKIPLHKEHSRLRMELEERDSEFAEELREIYRHQDSMRGHAHDRYSDFID